MTGGSIAARRALGVAVVCISLLLFGGASAEELPKVDSLVVLKSERKLMLMRGGDVLRTYRVALGIKPVGPKRQRGDERTPEGEYRIDARNPGSRFHRALHISYPNAEDRAEARALGVAPGGSIMIHGLPPDRAKLGKDHYLWDWTNGCIAVNNREMDEIWAAVDVGTPISIRP